MMILVLHHININISALIMDTFHVPYEAFKKFFKKRADLFILCCKDVHKLNDELVLKECGLLLKDDSLQLY
jgi:hypothetical protein